MRILRQIYFKAKHSRKTRLIVKLKLKIDKISEKNIYIYLKMAVEVKIQNSDSLNLNECLM